MKKYIYMAVAAIAALSSCSSDNDLLSGETGKKALTFTATMESDATRATYDSEKKCASWETTDQISVNGKTYNAQSAGLTTTFTAAIPGQEAEGTTYNAYFACTYDGTTATLPAAVSETWADGKFNMPMYATSNTTNLQFKNLCGVLKITVKNDEIDAVKSIKVSSANKAVSGAFTVSSDAAVLDEPNTVANTLTVTYTTAVSTEEGKVFYVAIPAQTYQELKIELDDGNGLTKIMTTKSDADIIVARKKIYPITFADNTTGTAEATINSNLVNVNWVQLWPGGPKFAEYNLGASSATDLGTMVTFAEATQTGDDYEWGANWCTPSKKDMVQLVKAASGAGSEEVSCEYVEEGGIWGFKFTGKKPGYTTNSVFFPGDGNNCMSYAGQQKYWSSKHNQGHDSPYYVWFFYNEGYWGSDFGDGSDSGNYLVRPVLKSSSNTTDDTGDDQNPGGTGDDPNSNSVTFNTSDFNFNEFHAVAENSDVSLELNASRFSWSSDFQFEGDGIMFIDAYPRPGVTVTEIVYTGSEGNTTKTRSWFDFEVENGNVMDGSTNLGNRLVSITVNYTKE